MCPGHTAPVELSPDFPVNQCLLPKSGKGPASGKECPDLCAIPQTFQLKTTSNVLLSKHPLSQVRTSVTPNESSGLLQNKGIAAIPRVPTRWQPWVEQVNTLGQLSHLPSFIKKLILKAALK